ncbi:signal peptidase II Aspartic peptidase. MEROPS family A08 [Rhizobium sp. RU35A]|uniref:signal peptidase II n=1 Tax=Rhizobium sp. RU35A TaxID=1907414 RepID=UPI0009567B13|nr:signal peptidase II [Rhizobium sp. RU35A]SIR12969.1 signal peptidase II Aspartic peptidase. MEROPS family A08 [Rhizobium sp. RU35A]
MPETVETKPTLLSRPVPILAFVCAAVLLDQVIKIAVEALLPLQEAVHVLPFFALYRTYNLGVAFSMLSDMEGWFIVTMRLVIVAFVLWLWQRTPKDRTFAHTGFALIIAGALGNILDRFIYGHVIDYLLFYTQTWSFAVFNLADSFITIGAGCVILDEILGSGRRQA